VVPSRHLLAERAVAAVPGVAGDAGEEAFDAVPAKEAKQALRIGNDGLSEAAVKGRPGVVAALLIGREESAIWSCEIDILDIDDEERRLDPGQYEIGGRRRAVVIDRAKIRLPIHQARSQYEACAIPV